MSPHFFGCTMRASGVLSLSSVPSIYPPVMGLASGAPSPVIGVTGSVWFLYAVAVTAILSCYVPTGFTDTATFITIGILFAHGPF